MVRPMARARLPVERGQRSTSSRHSVARRRRGSGNSRRFFLVGHSPFAVFGAEPRGHAFVLVHPSHPGGRRRDSMQPFFAVFPRARSAIFGRGVRTRVVGDSSRQVSVGLVTPIGGRRLWSSADREDFFLFFFRRRASGKRQALARIPRPDGRPSIFFADCVPGPPRWAVRLAEHRFEAGAGGATGRR